jgi:AcrR family transcriptional regulator
VVVHHQRERILAAALAEIAERGYRAVSVGDIVKRAAIARAKFYENFSSKEDCFSVAYERAVEEVVTRVAEGCAELPEAGFPERVSVGVTHLLAYLAEDPVRARACVVEAPSVSGAVEARREQGLKELAALLHSARRPGSEDSLPETVEESVLGGVYWLLYHAILSGKPKDLQKMRPELVEFVLLPFGGVGPAP